MRTQCKNTRCTVIYIKGKKKNKQKTKKKVSTVAIVPLGTVDTDADDSLSQQ